MVAQSTRLHELLLELGRHAARLHPDDDVRAVPLTQLFALHELDEDDSLSQRELGERLHLEKSTVSRLVADLVRARLVTQERDPGNRRYSRIRITEHGRSAHRRIGSGMHERYARLVADLTTAERDALLVGLPALVRALREE